MDELLREFEHEFEKFPVFWDGKKSILEMKESGYSQWRQNEWIGFFFQYLCDKNLPKIGMQIPGDRFGNAQFDGHLIVDWDFKAHPARNKDGKENTILIANDFEATENTIQKYGKTGLIVATGEATFDDPISMPFREWHKALKGGDSAYSLSNQARGASKRLYKTKFRVNSIDIYVIDQQVLETQGRFQEGMRNSNGNPRRSKLAIDLSRLSPIKRITL